MNEKFFDLKKEKQDRMINASFRAFAGAGFTHASTDDIVKEAGVSKGLLFHYFESKLGLYEFLYDYAAKYEQLEISSCVERDEADFFRIREQILRAQANCMKNYPFLPLFLDRADREEDESAGKVVGEKVMARAAFIRELLLRADHTLFVSGADVTMVSRMLTGTFREILNDAIRTGDPSGEFYRVCASYLEMMRGLCLKGSGGNKTEDTDGGEGANTSQTEEEGSEV